MKIIFMEEHSGTYEFTIVKINKNRINQQLFPNSLRELTFGSLYILYGATTMAKNAGPEIFQDEQ
jgi:hypothetical protein